MKPDEQFDSSPEAATSSPFQAEYRGGNDRPLRPDLHVDLTRDWEIYLWTRHFDCSEPELRRAVKAAGDRAADVRTWLRRHRT